MKHVFHVPQIRRYVLLTCSAVEKGRWFKMSRVCCKVMGGIGSTFGIWHKQGRLFVVRVDYKNCYEPGGASAAQQQETR